MTPVTCKDHSLTLQSFTSLTLSLISFCSYSKTSLARLTFSPFGPTGPRTPGSPDSPGCPVVPGTPGSPGFPASPCKKLGSRRAHPAGGRLLSWELKTLGALGWGWGWGWGLQGNREWAWGNREKEVESSSDRWCPPMPTRFSPSAPSVHGLQPCPGEKAFLAPVHSQRTPLRVRHCVRPRDYSSTQNRPNSLLPF